MTEKKKPVILLCLILLLAFAVNAFYLRNDSFFGDDYNFIINNIYIRSLRNIPAFFTTLAAGSSFRGTQVSYRPITTATFALNYYLGAFDPFGYHVFNLLVHLFNIVMVYLIVRHITRQDFLALATALVFGLHPINSEVVNYINTRSSSFSVSFYLLSLYLYMMKLSSGSRGKRALLLAGSLVAFAAAMFTKELSITLPLVIMAYYLIFRKKRLGEGIRETLLLYPPYFIISAVFLAVRYRLLKVEGLLQGAHHLYRNIYQPAQIFLYQLKVLAYPDLSLYYLDFNPSAYLDLRSGLSLALILLMLAGLLALHLWSKRKDVIFFIYLMLITALPTTIVEMKVNFSLILDHRLYIMLVGASFLGAVLLHEAACALKRLFNIDDMKVYAACVLTAGMIYSALYAGRNSVWRNGVTLGQDLVARYPGHSSAHYVLGQGYMRSNDPFKAVAAFRKAIELNPSNESARVNVSSRVNIAGILVQEGFLDGAMEEYKQVIVYDPSNSNAHFGLGYIYGSKGLYEEAIREYEEGLAYNPMSLAARLNLAGIFLTNGLSTQAESEYRKALEIDPANAEALSKLESLGGL